MLSGTSTRRWNRELARLAAERRELDAEYVRLTAPLALGTALAGAEPTHEDLERISANRTRVACRQREQLTLLVDALKERRAFRDLIGWFDLAPAIDSATPTLSIGWSPRSTRYRGRVEVRVIFGADAEPNVTHVRFDTDLIAGPPDAAAMHDLMASALHAMAAPGCRESRVLARNMRLRGLASLAGVDARDLQLRIGLDQSGGRISLRVERLCGDSVFHPPGRTPPKRR
jgi:hypothetical protein